MVNSPRALTLPISKLQKWSLVGAATIATHYLFLDLYLLSNTGLLEILLSYWPNLEPLLKPFSPSIFFFPFLIFLLIGAVISLGTLILLALDCYLKLKNKAWKTWNTIFVSALLLVAAI